MNVPLFVVPAATPAFHVNSNIPQSGAGHAPVTTWENDTDRELFGEIAGKSKIESGIPLVKMSTVRLSVSTPFAVPLDSYAFNRKQKYFNKPQVKLPQVVG